MNINFNMKKLNLLVWLSFAFSRKCIPGKFNCSGEKMKICSAEGIWIISECPIATKCEKTQFSISCSSTISTEQNAPKLLENEQEILKELYRLSNYENENLAKEIARERKNKHKQHILKLKSLNAELAARKKNRKIEKTKSNEIKENPTGKLKMKIIEKLKIKKADKTPSYQLQERDKGFIKSILKNSTSYLIDDPVETHLSRDLITSEQKFAMDGEWKELDPNLKKEFRKITAVKDAKTSNIIMSEPIPLETVIGKKNLTKSLKLRILTQ